MWIRVFEGGEANAILFLTLSFPRGDQTSAEAYLTVLPRAMECVVFSIDGSFAASVSIMGSDPKVRPGAVDVVRQVLSVFEFVHQSSKREAVLTSAVRAQTLAGPGIPDHLHHRSPGHAEAARCFLALAAQLPPWDDLLLWRLGPRSPATEDHLP